MGLQSNKTDDFAKLIKITALGAFAVALSIVILKVVLAPAKEEPQVAGNTPTIEKDQKLQTKQETKREIVQQASLNSNEAVILVEEPDNSRIDAIRRETAELFKLNNPDRISADLEQSAEQNDTDNGAGPFNIDTSITEVLTDGLVNFDDVVSSISQIDTANLKQENVLKLRDVYNWQLAKDDTQKIIAMQEIKDLNVEKISRIITNEAKKYNIDPLLVTAIIKNQSNFDRYAESKDSQIGLMQITPKEGRDLALQMRTNYLGDITLQHPLFNTRLGVFKLNKLLLSSETPKQAIQNFYTNEGSDPKKLDEDVNKTVELYTNFVSEIQKAAESNQPAENEDLGVSQSELMESLKSDLQQQ